MAEPIDRLQLMQFRAIMEVGYHKCAVECGLMTAYISLRLAFKMYGRKTVLRWADEKLITVIKDGTGTSKCRIKRDEIELIAAASNRASWYEHYE